MPSEEEKKIEAIPLGAARFWEGLTYHFSHPINALKDDAEKAHQDFNSLKNTPQALTGAFNSARQQLSNTGHNLLKKAEDEIAPITNPIRKGINEIKEGEELLSEAKNNPWLFVIALLKTLASEMFGSSHLKDFPQDLMKEMHDELAAKKSPAPTNAPALVPGH